jgi:hypothetical protein
MTATLLARCDVYRFFGLPIAIRSTAPAVLADLRAKYRRFLEQGAVALPPPEAVGTIDVFEPIASRRREGGGDGDWGIRIARAGGEDVLEPSDGGARQAAATRKSCDPATLVLTAVLEMVTRQRETTLCLCHVGAVASGRRAMLIVGEPGTGRSTLVVKLLERGYRLLSAGVACIDVAGRRVLPFPERLNVCDQSRRLLGLDASRAVSGRRRSDGAREWTFDAEDLGFAYEPDDCVPTVAVYLKGFRDQPRIQPLSPVRALLDLVACRVGSQSGPSASLLQLAPLVAGLRCYDVFLGAPEISADFLMRTMPGPAKRRPPLRSAMLAESRARSGALRSTEATHA